MIAAGENHDHGEAIVVRSARKDDAMRQMMRAVLSDPSPPGFEQIQQQVNVICRDGMSLYHNNPDARARRWLAILQSRLVAVGVEPNGVTLWQQLNVLAGEKEETWNDMTPEEPVRLEHAPKGNVREPFTELSLAAAKKTKEKRSRRRKKKRARHF